MHNNNLKEIELSSFKKEQETEIQHLIQLSKFKISKVYTYADLENVLTGMKTSFINSAFSEQINSLLIKGQIYCLMSQMQQSYMYFSIADNFLTSCDNIEIKQKLNNNIDESQLLLYKTICSLFITKMRSECFQIDFDFAENECEKMEKLLSMLQGLKCDDNTIEIDVLLIKLKIARGNIAFLKMRTTQASIIFHDLLCKLEELKSEQLTLDVKNDKQKFISIDNLRQEVINLESIVHFSIAKVLKDQLKTDQALAYGNHALSLIAEVFPKAHPEYIEKLLFCQWQLYYKKQYKDVCEGHKMILEQLKDNLRLTKQHQKTDNNSVNSSGNENNCQFEFEQSQIEGMPVNSFVATCLHRIALCQKHLENDKEKGQSLGIGLIFTSMKIRKRLFGEVSRSVGLANFDIGNCYVDWKHPDMALQQYDNSLSVLDRQFRSQHYPFRASILLNKASVLLQMGQLETAKQMLLQALAAQGIPHCQTFNLETFSAISEDFRGPIQITAYIFQNLAIISLYENQDNNGYFACCQQLSISAECYIKCKGEISKYANDHYRKCANICNEHLNFELEKYYQVKSLLHVHRYKMMLSLTQVSQCLKNMHFFRPDDVCSQIVELFNYDKFANDQQIHQEFSQNVRKLNNY